MGKKVQAIYDDDLIEFLKSIKEYRNIVEEKIKCKLCGNTITLSNISHIFPESGAVKFICDNPKCILSVGKLTERDL